MLKLFLSATKIALAFCLLAFTGQLVLAATPTGTFTQAGQGLCPTVPAGIDTAFIYLLTDGTVVVHDQSGTNQNWYRLTPDNTGSYACGTWTALASIPNSFSYGPRFYAAAVLPDARFAIAGGEYNLGSGTASWTNLGAIYLPKTDQWLPIRPPAGWASIGDGQGAVLPNGQWMIADALSKKQAFFNVNNLTFTPTGKLFAAGTNDEAAWTLLPDGSFFTVDNNIVAPGGTQNGERWINGTWYKAATIGTQQLFDGQQEMGPQVLLPDGTVLAIGGTGNVSIYTPPPVASPPSTASGSWANTTKLPATCGTANNAQCGANNAAGVLLPSGNVLLFASVAGDGTKPNEFRPGAHFFEFDRTVGPPVWNQVTEPGPLATQLAGDPSYVGSLMMLPNGQALFTDGINNGSTHNQVWLYTPNGTPNAAWKPTLSTWPSVINRNQTYNISGILFNGMSQANFYGDDAQNATNFPIVQVTMNAAPNHVYYGRTHDFSAMGVARTTLPVSAKFELWKCPQVKNAACVPETGAATLRVIANGIASNPVNVTINP